MSFDARFTADDADVADLEAIMAKLPADAANGACDIAITERDEAGRIVSIEVTLQGGQHDK